MTPTQKPRILSGMRPTGKLHLGHLYGALINWVELQNKYESFHFVADWHALTTHYEDTSNLRENTEEMVMDWLAAGLDPAKATFFIQSRILEHAELHLLFSMITPLGWLERVPTYKEQLQNIKDRDLHTYGFLGYPVLQSADILMYKANAVPVGEDQVPHVELTREIARRFNLAYGTPRPETPNLNGKTYAESSLEAKAEFIHRGLVEVKGVFPEPEALLTPTPRLPGTDGRRMAKSYGNTIMLSEPAESVSKKLATMITDPARKRRTDKGNPDVCPVFDLHKVFSTAEERAYIDPRCRAADIGCLDCKKILAGNINARLEPMRQRRAIYEKNPEQVWKILDEGTERARKVAEETMKEVRAAVKIDYKVLPAELSGKAGAKT